MSFPSTLVEILPTGISFAIEGTPVNINTYIVDVLDAENICNKQRSTHLGVFFSLSRLGQPTRLQGTLSQNGIDFCRSADLREDRRAIVPPQYLVDLFNSADLFR